MTRLQSNSPRSARGNSSPTIVFCANTAWNLANFRGPIIASLVADNFRVIAAAASDGTEQRLVELGAEFRPLPVASSGRNPLADLRLLGALVRLLVRERPSAFLSFTIKPNIYGSLAARMTGTRAMATISGLGSAFLAGGPLGRLIDSLYRIGLARVAAVFFQNDDDRDLFLERRLVSAAQVRRVPGSGIDLEHFALADPPINERPVFLFIGRLLWDKGVREFVESARILDATGQKPEFRMIGECGVDNPSAVTLSEVERWAADETISYLGPKDDVRQAIAAADCIVLPSYREGVPRSLLEGAAMGRPLIASDVPGCREVVEHERNGFLCEPRSALALAEAVRRMAGLSREQRREMGLRSRARVEREFAVQRVVAAYRTELGV